MSGRHRRERRSIPTHIRDQYEAAEREVVEVMQGVAKDIGVEMEFAPNEDPGDPTMTALIASIKEQLFTGQARSCGHTATPQPLFIAAWDNPLVVRCQTCSFAQPGLTGDDDVRCDSCGNVDHTGIWPAQIALGPIVVFMGRCDDCTPDRVKNRP
jgi:hypothetical protein